MLIIHFFLFHFAHSASSSRWLCGRPKMLFTTFLQLCRLTNGVMPASILRGLWEGADRWWCHVEVKFSNFIEVSLVECYFWVEIRQIFTKTKICVGGSDTTPTKKIFSDTTPANYLVSTYLVVKTPPQILKIRQKLQKCPPQTPTS